MFAFLFPSCFFFVGKRGLKWLRRSSQSGDQSLGGSLARVCGERPFDADCFFFVSKKKSTCGDLARTGPRLYVLVLVLLPSGLRAEHVECWSRRLHLPASLSGGSRQVWPRRTGDCSRKKRERAREMAGDGSTLKRSSWTIFFLMRVTAVDYVSDSRQLVRLGNVHERDAATLFKPNATIALCARRHCQMLTLAVC